MKLFRSYMYYLLGAILLLSVFLVPSVSNAEDTFIGDNADAGKLRFGIGWGQRPRDPIEEGKIRNTPIVQYIQSESDVINHIFKNRTNGFATTSPLNIIENLDEYGMESSYDNGSGKIVLPNPGIKKTDRIIVTEGKKQGSEDFLVNVEMEADSRNTRVLHTYTITNKSNETKVIYPMKQVDTELADNDDVPVFSRGPNRGLYIESLALQRELTYRLDYITDVKNGPIAYHGMNQYEAFQTVFGDDLTNPVAELNGQPVSELEEDACILEGDDEDTGIFMAWGEKTLEPGESIELAYAVGLSSSTDMEIKKEVKNTTTKDDLNRVGDVLSYVVTLKNKSDLETGLVEKVTISDNLPAGVEKPTKIELTHADGEKEGYPVEDAYDEKTHSINVKPEDLMGQDVILLKYSVKVRSDAGGKTLKNEAIGSGENANGVSFEVTDVTETEILKTNIITINYQDETGMKLTKPKIIQGTVGDSYEEKPIEIFGYNYDSVMGNSSGEFTGDDESITFVYKAKEMFKITQEVFDITGNDANQKEVGLGDVLTYTATIIPESQNLSEAEKETVYKMIEINKLIDPNLTDVQSIKLMTEAGIEIGEVVYDAQTHLVTGKISEADKVGLEEKIILTYQATVQSTTEIGTIIKQHATANVRYVGSDILDVEAISNEVTVTVNRGELIFESAPKTLNFGLDNKVSSKDKIIDLSEIDTDLTVRDLRGTGSQWSMTVKLIDDLKNGETSLTDALHYIRDGEEQLINKDASAIVYQKTTDSNKVVNISNQWSEKNKPVLKIKAGLARTGNYEGTIQWALQDVPVFDEE